jgi:hypothetical protein
MSCLVCAFAQQLLRSKARRTGDHAIYRRAWRLFSELACSALTEATRPFARTLRSRAIAPIPGVATWHATSKSLERIPQKTLVAGFHSNAGSRLRIGCKVHFLRYFRARDQLPSPSPRFQVETLWHLTNRRSPQSLCNARNYKSLSTTRTLPHRISGSQSWQPSAMRCTCSSARYLSTCLPRHGFFALAPELGMN